MSNDNLFYATKRKGHTYTFSTGLFVESNADWYKELQNLLLKVDTDDTININVHNQGGSVPDAIALIYNIRQCKAKVHMTVTGVCASAATLIVLSVPSKHITINPDSYWLFHNASCITWGKHNEIKDQIDFSIKQIGHLFKKYYTKVLTKKELKKVLEGKELYLTGKEVATRLSNSK